MKKNFKKLCALVVAVAMIATDALPVAAAGRETNSVLEHLQHVHGDGSYEGMTGMDFSILGEKALEFLKEFDVEEFKSAFGKKVEGYDTEALKDAIWEAIFIRRDSNYIDVESLGISRDVMDALVGEVLAEANAEQAVTYAVRKDAEGNATEVQVAIDPLYAEAYAEIEAGTFNAGSSNYTVNAASDEIVVAAEGDQAEGGQQQEATMEDAIAYFNQYQQFIDENPDLFGVTVPYTSVKDDSNEGGGPITSLVTIANQKVDYNGDGLVDEQDGGITMLDLFKMGYVPASDLIQIIQMFHLGNQLAANLMGEELVATMQEALSIIPNNATAEQKLLLLNDWLADKATFDMASIMELPAPEPTTPEIFGTVVYVLQTPDGGNLDEATATQLAQNLMGLWGGNQFGVLTPSMGHKGVCMSYTYAYAYLVQWAFSDVYKNKDGSWKTRLELNYIENPNAELSTGRTVLAADDVDPETCEHEYVATWVWNNYSSATATAACKQCETVLGTATDNDIHQDYPDATCVDPSMTVYTAAVTIEGKEFTDVKKIPDGFAEATGHSFKNDNTQATCSVCGAENPNYQPPHECTWPTVAVDGNWTWTENATGGYTASVTVECTDATCEEKLTETATVTGPVTTEAPTCAKEGKAVYTAKSANYEGTKEVPVAKLTTHTWPEAAATDDWTWAEAATGGYTASVTVKCTVEGCEETNTETATVTSVVTPATCGVAGSTVYTATSENYTGTKTDVIDALGHDFSDNAETCRREGCDVVNEDYEAPHVCTWPETAAAENWTWTKTETGYTASVTVECTDEECTLTQTSDATVSEPVVTPATCATEGKEVYTATAGTYTSTKEVVLDKLTTHTYAAEAVWAEALDENKAAKAVLPCTVEGCDHELVLSVSVAAPVTVNPTCTEAGSTTYTATITNEDVTVENKTKDYVETIAATGHKYDETAEPDAWTWDANNTAAKAVYNCTVEGCTGTTTIEATVKSETTKTDATTCVDLVTETYTATIKNSAGTEFTDVVTKEIPGGKHKINSQGTCTVCGTQNIPQYIWDPSAPAMVDFVRITYDTEVTMYGESQGNFDSDHYWNAVKVNGQWYYVDPCYTDIYVECMIRDRVETDGNMSHIYFMFSDTNCRQLYEGNFSNIDTLYEGIATDTTYEDAWFAFARSPIYRNGTNYYYYYDSTDMIGLTVDAENNYNEETEYKLVYHDGTLSDTDSSFTTLVDFNAGQVRVVSRNQATMQDNALIKDLFAKHQAYQDNYPSVDISCDMEGSRLYFNLANCVLYYDVDTYEVVKVFEYNEVTAQRDMTQGLGGMAFSVIDADDAVAAEAGAELTTITVQNNPIASMTIKNGNMYVSVGTTIGFISGKKSMSEDDTSIGYQFEETNYNPDYTQYIMSEGQMGEDDNNDNDEFMWSANFVDVIEMSHIKGTSHTYEEVYVEATCGENAFTEQRCADCGLIKADSRVEVANTALDHHYIKFDEQYYTKEGDAWNTGSCYVCTICKDAKDADELESTDHVGHDVYVGLVTAWNEDYTEATMDVACETCYGVNYDCVLADETVVLAESVTTTNITKERTSEVDAATGEKAYYYVYTATVEVNGKSYSDSIKVSREEDKYDRNPFTDVPNDVWYTDPVLWAVENGITNGVTATEFGPFENCTRAQAVTFLYRQAGQPEVKNQESPFTDLEEGAYYYNAVLWAVENGITNGVSATEFAPNEECTRGQIVTFIWRMVGKPQVENVEINFTDVEADAYYYDAICWAVENGITNGVNATEFAPAEICTRAQIVTFLYREFADK